MRQLVWERTNQNYQDLSPYDFADGHSVLILVSYVFRNCFVFPDASPSKAMKLAQVSFPAKSTISSMLELLNLIVFPSRF